MFRKALIIIGGTGAAQLVSLGVLPLLLRVYRPEEFGFFAIFSAACWIVGVLATFQLEHRIILQRTRGHAHHLVKAIILVGTSIAFIAAMLLWAFVETLRARLPMPLAAPYLSAIAFATVTGISITQALRALLVREGRFYLISRGAIITAVVNSIVALLPTFFLGSEYRRYGLLLAQASGLLVTAGIWLRISGMTWSSITRHKGYLQLVAMFTKEHRVAGVLVLSNATKTAYARIPAFVVGEVGGATAAGHFGLVERVVSAPSTLLAQAIGAAFRNEVGAAAARHDHLSVLRLYRRTVLTALLVSGPVYLLSAVFAPALFGFVFGETWRIAGEYASILLVGEIAVFTLTAVEDTSVLLNMNRYRFCWHLGQLAAIGALWVACLVDVIETAASVCWGLAAIRSGFAFVDVSVFTFVYRSLDCGPSGIARG